MGKAIKINPFVFLTANAIESHADAAKLAENIFTEVEMEPGIDWIYRELSYTPDNQTFFGQPQSVDTFEVASFSAMANDFGRTGDTLFVDENGLYNNVNDVWIVLRGAWQPFAGPGLVLGTDNRGNSIPPKHVTVDWLQNNCIILVQNLVYIPRVKRLGAVMGSAVRMVARNNLCDFKNPIWTDPNILT